MLQANMFKLLITTPCDVVLAKITKKDYSFQTVSFLQIHSHTMDQCVLVVSGIPDFATRLFISPVKSTIVRFEPGFHRRNVTFVLKHISTLGHEPKIRPFTYSQPLPQ